MAEALVIDTGPVLQAVRQVIGEAGRAPLTSPGSQQFHGLLELRASCGKLVRISAAIQHQPEVVGGGGQSEPRPVQIRRPPA